MNTSAPATDQRLISVAMNGMNSARYLKEAIDSVLAQTCTDWELVFWDNCSTDNSRAIVEGYGDPRIRFYCAPQPMSLAAGRNAAIGQCRGSWIAFLDCDDRWLPEKLALQLERLAQSGESDVGLVYTRTQSFSEHGNEGETTYRYTGRPLPEGDILEAMLAEGNLIPIVSAMTSRQAVASVGPIPEKYTFAEDYWLFTAIAARFRVLCVQDTCSLYRVHAGSATYSNKLASHREALEVLEQWGDRLAPRKLAKRRAEYHTLIGIERLRLHGQRLAGLREIAAQGSIPFLLRGSATTLFRRWIKRKRPYS